MGSRMCNIGWNGDLEQSKNQAHSNTREHTSCSRNSSDQWQIRACSRATFCQPPRYIARLRRTQAHRGSARAPELWGCICRWANSFLCMDAENSPKFCGRADIFPIPDSPDSCGRRRLRSARTPPQRHSYVGYIINWQWFSTPQDISELRSWPTRGYHRYSRKTWGYRWRALDPSPCATTSWQLAQSKLSMDCFCKKRWGSRPIRKWL